MEITGTFNANVTNVSLKADNTNDGQEIVIDVIINLNPDEAFEKFGEAFYHVAFACMRERVEPGEDGNATMVRFGYSSKKPPKWLRPSVHKINLWGMEQKGQPKIRKIEAGDDERAIYAHLRFTFDANENAKIIGTLGAMCGKTGKIKLKPVHSAAFPVKAPPKEKPKSTAQKRQPPLHAVG